MSIRIQEWGMLHAPETGVRIPLEGMHGWIESAEKWSAGAAGALIRGAEALQAEEKVAAGGELAAFSEQLQRIGRETAEELADGRVDDWDYSWAALSSPRIAEAVEALPPHARQAGQELARAYSAQASLCAQRDRKVQGIARARRQWQERVDAAVQSGDAQRAEQWLQSGAGVFVPESEVKEQCHKAESAACAVRWRRALQANPWQALADFAEAKPALLPDDAQEYAKLEQQMLRQHGESRRELAWALLQGESRSHEELQGAVKAGLMTREQARQCGAAPRSLSTAERVQWMRRIDESAGDAAGQAEVLMALATAPMPQQTRRELAARAELTARVDAQDCRALSRRLLNVYAEGGFGCPQDAEAAEQLCRLLQAGLRILAEQGSDAAADWLNSAVQHCNVWISLNDLTII